jgi:hypothetical protein
MLAFVVVFALDCSQQRTPYSDQLGTPPILSFALGPDVTVNTIFGLPMLCDLDPVISLRSNSLHSRALKLDFPITRGAVHFGLPPDCTFDPASATRSQASTCGLRPPDTSSSFNPGTAAPLAIASDDTSLGYLQCTVHPSI